MSDPFGQIGLWLMNLLTGLGLEPGLAGFLLKLVGAGALAMGAMLSTFLLIWGERRLLARLQDRLGPNRLGPWGILQTVGDFGKLVTKEVITPASADKVTFWLAPMLTVLSAVAVWAVLPLAKGLVGTDINVGVVFVVAIGSIGMLGIMLAGWSAGNKYSLLGAFRAVSQLVSYEVPMVLVLLIPTLLSGSMGLVAIVEAQRPVWFVVMAPLALVIFYISSLAENGRAPFDLLEGESEIATGFNIEYTGLMFGMFYVAEFLHAFTVSALMATLFFGGWQGPGAERYPLLGVMYFFGKTLILWWSIIWVRMSLPRVRIDHMLALNWKILTPVALGLVAATAIAGKLAPADPLARSLALLVANGVVLAGTVFGLWLYGRARRRPAPFEGWSRAHMVQPRRT